MWYGEERNMCERSAVCTIQQIVHASRAMTHRTDLPKVSTRDRYTAVQTMLTRNIDSLNSSSMLRFRASAVVAGLLRSQRSAAVQCRTFVSRLP